MLMLLIIEKRVELVTLIGGDIHLASRKFVEIETLKMLLSEK